MEKTSRCLPIINTRFGVYTFSISPRLNQNEALLFSIEAKKKDQESIKLSIPVCGPPESIRMLVTTQMPGYKVRPVNCGEYLIKPKTNTCFYLENNGNLPELNELDAVSLHIADPDIQLVSMFVVEIA